MSVIQTTTKLEVFSQTRGDEKIMGLSDEILLAFFIILIILTVIFLLISFKLL